MAINFYLRNRYCPCARCRTRGLLGPAVLITLGVLFLLQEFDTVQFDQSFPVLLIVIGLFLYFSRVASTEGHVQPFGLGGQPQPPQPPAPSQPNDPQVKP